MRVSELRDLVAMDQIREGLLKTSQDGWQVALEDFEGHQFPLTDATGRVKTYHSLDRATDILKSLGVRKMCIQERF
ncbi:hypothetical protein QKW35_08785 [Pontibacterium granulatum]|uniref:hypothetical protein n=1 Tax=Pontibacterium TaxID=2036025 RepID=UPI00249A3539|nr:hypothetical protein [Pontibacterium granulatum]MDI3324468.1 hypothetical protein [Pontibacterium granulatum]